MRRLRSLWQHVVRRGRAERALDDELRACLEILTNQGLSRGLSPREARRQAHVALGGVESVKEAARGARAGAFVNGLFRDIRIGLRSLWSAPSVSGMAILSLALALGANTAVFTVTNSLMLRALPVSHPENLILVTDGVVTGGNEARIRAWSYPVWEQIRQRGDLVDSLAAWSFARFKLGGAGNDERVDGLWVSGSLLETLGVGARTGRVLTVDDDRRGGGRDGLVAMISHALWLRHFDGAADVVGRSIRLEGVVFRVVGVTPRVFTGPEVGRTFDVLLPLSAEPVVRGANSFIDSADSLGTNFLTIVGRLRRGQSLAVATDAFRIAQPDIRASALASAGSLAHSDDVARYVMAAPFALVSAPAGFSSLRNGYGRALGVMSGIVAVVLLLACVNLASLLLAQADKRRHEVVVRLALGASRPRLIRQFLVESVILAAIGAGCGLVLGALASRALVAQLSTPSSHVYLDLSLSAEVIVLTIGLTGLTTLLFGTVPAFSATRVAPNEILKDQGRSSVVRRRGTWSNGLVVLQVSLSIVLLVSAALFIQSFVRLTTRDLGFEPERVLVTSMDTPASISNAERLPMFERTRDVVQALPGVTAAGLSLMTPISGGGFTPPIEVSGVTAEIGDEMFGNLISRGWLRAMGTPVLAGRDFDDGDHRGSRRVALVNQTFVARVLRGVSPLGRSITLFPHRPIAQAPMEIVGVVRDAVYTSLRDDVPPTWYAPLEQFELLEFPFSSMNLVTRPKDDTPAALAKHVDAAIRATDARIAPQSIVLQERVHGSVTQERLLAQLAGFFGVVAVLLAGLGVYGITAQAVARRRREIGLRIALGADASHVIRLVIARTAVLLGLGIGGGLVVSFWISSAAEGLVYQVATRDIGSSAAAVALLVITGGVAAWWPARQASRIDPIKVLRDG